MDDEMISVEAERALIARAQSGDRRAQDKLVEAFTPLVMFYAKRRVGYGIDKDDLIQEGRVALMKALGRYSLDYGNRFGAYAKWWVIAAVDGYTCDNWSIVKQRMGGKVKNVHRAIGDEGRDRSMDHKRDNGETWGNSLPEEITPQDEAFDEKRTRERWLAELERRLAVLTPRERVIIRARWPDADESIRLEVIGRYFGLTRERIRQIEAKALAKMGLPGKLHNEGFVEVRKQRMVESSVGRVSAMANDYNGHHLSVGDRKGHEKPPIPLHKRLAMGEKVDGMGKDPNGAAKGPTDNRIANNQGKRY